MSKFGKDAKLYAWNRKKGHYLHRLVIALQITVLKHLVLVSLIREKCLNLKNVFVFPKS